MNMVDGMWANTFVPDAVPKPWVVIVDKIRFEEQGEGDLAKNHPYMWNRTAASVGFAFPPVAAEAFALHPGFDDRAFWNAALTASVGRLHGWVPEKLGMIAFVEMSSSSPCHKQIQHMKAHGLDFSYYQVHRSIDNPHSGHGAQIFEAIKGYLSEASGVGQERDWSQRVCRGYHAFEYTIDAIDAAVAERTPSGGCPKPSTPSSTCTASAATVPATEEHHARIVRDMEHFVERYPQAHLFHRGEPRRLLQQPGEMVRYLMQRCELFRPGETSATGFMRLFAPGGPMYGIGSTSEDRSVLSEFASMVQRSCNESQG